MLHTAALRTIASNGAFRLSRAAGPVPRTPWGKPFTGADITSAID